MSRGRERTSRYQALTVLGRGASGTVYLARQSSLDRMVALKVFDPVEMSEDSTRLARFRAEARVCAALVHPNVIRVLDVGLESDRPWIAYEYVPGCTLHSLIRRGPVPWRRLVRMGAQVARALRHAHRAGVLHRDVKPENILVGEHDNVKLIDFGLSCDRDHDHGTRTGRLVGTPLYLAPELLRAAPHSHRSDVYALGMTLLVCLLGGAPFDPSDAWNILEWDLAAAIVECWRLQPGIPRSLMMILERCLARNPLDRYQEVDELYRDLTRLLETLASPGGYRSTARLPVLARKGSRTSRSRASRPSPPVTLRGSLARLISASSRRLRALTRAIGCLISPAPPAAALGAPP